MQLNWNPGGWFQRAGGVVQQQVVIGLNAVIVAVTEETPRILTVKGAEPGPGRGTKPADSPPPRPAPPDALPYGPFDPANDRTLELGLGRWVREQTGHELGYVEQLYTFGNRNRDPREREGGPRVISVAYLALVREGRPSGKGAWRDWYHFFPWEDWRAGRPGVIEEVIVPVLDRWVEAARKSSQKRERRERSDIYFGLGGAPWVAERVLERYELIYEIGLAAEARRDRLASRSHRGPRAAGGCLRGCTPSHLGEPMALDHRRILASALGRLRGKLKYRPVVFELLPAAFTLLQLQRVVEALAGSELHKQNLRRLLETGGFVEGTGRFEGHTGGRPAELFRFRREVLRERPAPGVGLPRPRH